ncbi:MAG: Rab family GTPase [Candidatus Heimdallarchaeota archaeon]
MSIEPKRAYKIVLIGDPEVGKTSIRRKYMGKSFRADYLKTLGADFAAQKVDVEGEAVLLTIWDLAGQSIFHGMRSSFYHGCKCALVVCDVTNSMTLENSYKWAEEATKFAKNSLQELYLIGNKIDLKNDRAVEPTDLEELAKEFTSTFNFPVKVYETSALTGENINELFEHMSKKLIMGDLVNEEETDVRSGEMKPIKADATKISSSSKSKKISQILSLIDDLEDRIAKINKTIAEVKEQVRKLE